MQFLPSATAAEVNDTLAEEARAVTSSAKKTADSVDSGAFASILEGLGKDSGGKLSSFIAAGRTKYTGVPEGFAAFDEASGTMTTTMVDKFRASLKKRGVQEASLDSLNQLMASGAPMTVSRIFSTLTGEARSSAALDENERLNFSQLMQKLGFTQDEAASLLEMSDAGQTSGLMKNLNKKIGGLSSSLEDGVEVHAEEFLSLISGLDLTEKTRARMLKDFGSEDSKVLNRESLQALLASAGNEIGSKDLAAKAVQKELRNAMDEAMQAAKLAERNAAVSDKRGSHYLHQSEALMQGKIAKKLNALEDEEAEDGNPLLPGKRGGKKAATPETAEQAARREADVTGQTSRRNASGEGAGEDAPKRQSRAERILQTAEDKNGKTREGAREAFSDDATQALNRMMRKVDTTAAAAVNTLGGQNTFAGLAGLASAYRQEIFTQVESGIMQSLNNGQQRLTLRLAPEELGQVTVILTVHHNELKASIKTDSPESAAALSEQLESLRASLEEQGFKVAELDVQCHMQDNPAANQWNGESGHNEMFDAQERARATRLNQLRRDEGISLGAMLEQRNAPALSQAGLHIIA